MPEVTLEPWQAAVVFQSDPSERVSKTVEDALVARSPVLAGDPGPLHCGVQLPIQDRPVLQIGL